ncbi:MULTISPECIES: hypothetical protein [unclassified Variovorax]|nr:MULTISPECIES: hypothetical protein [unclassified Variovorax]
MTAFWAKAAPAKVSAAQAAINRTVFKTDFSLVDARKSPRLRPLLQ